MNENQIERAVQIVGGQSKLASQINVSQGLVWQWINGQTKVTPRHFAAIEQATAGAVTRQDLRPDIFGEPAERVA